MDYIAGNTDHTKLPIPWHQDRTMRFDYSIEQLSNYLNPSNQIWYYMDYKFQKLGKGNFNDQEIFKLDVNQINELIGRIDSKYKGKEFDRKILADLGTEFYEIIIPKIIELTKQNTGLPKSLKRSMNGLMLIMLIGVIFPLLIQSMSLCPFWDTWLTLTSVWLTSLILINFLINFYQFINEDVRLHPKNID